jgi:hypothetical protein
MPFGDGTGPAGLGPMTGRAAGYCAGYGVPGYTNPYAGGRGLGFGWGRGFGRGRGYGRGYGRGMRGRWFYGNPYPANEPYPTGPVSYPFASDPAGDPYAVWQTTPEQEKEMLLSQTKVLEEQLGDMKKRIAELEKEARKEK